MGSESEAGGESGVKNGINGDQAGKDIYENRPGMKKLIRLLTVMTYLVSVSFVAVVLSAYYVFLWQPPNPKITMHAHTSIEGHAEFLMDSPPSPFEMKSFYVRNDKFAEKKKISNDHDERKSMDIKYIALRNPNNGTSKEKFENRNRTRIINNLKTVYDYLADHNRNISLHPKNLKTTSTNGNMKMPLSVLEKKMSPVNREKNVIADGHSDRDQRAKAVDSSSVDKIDDAVTGIVGNMNLQKGNNAILYTKIPANPVTESYNKTIEQTKNGAYRQPENSP